IVNTFKDLDLHSVDQSQPVEEVAGSGMRKGDIMVGKPSAFELFEDPHQYLSKAIEGNTNIFVGKNNQIAGYFSLADQVREESAHAVAGFQREGIQVSLLTGDNETVAKKVAEEVGIDDYVASCLPEDKIRYVNESQEKDKVV